MTDKNKTEESIRFVTRHYREDTLLAPTGWQRFRLTHHISSFRRNAVAASIGLAVLAASASLYYFTVADHNTAQEENAVIPITETTVAPENRIERIEFHDAPLKEVVAEIERVYGVTISNLPDSDISITISYEGTAADVVETINDLLGSSLTVTTEPDSNSRK